ncbi:MAG: porin family protein [Nitrospirae bacterium]|nr:porin family protein [Nitrospirota bacterium]
MKSLMFSVTLSLLFVLPFSVWGQEKKNYVLLKGGLFTFSGAVREATIDMGFNAEVALGHYYSPHVAVEIGTGYFHDGVNKGYGNEIKGMPFIVTAKALYPIKGFELFAGGGLGLYLAEFHGQYRGIVAEESDAVFGGHIQAGVNADVARNFFVGLEGKYVFTGKADFKILESRVGGHTVTVDFGYRF